MPKKAIFFDDTYEYPAEVRSRIRADRYPPSPRCLYFNPRRGQRCKRFATRGGTMCAMHSTKTYARKRERERPIMMSLTEMTRDASDAVRLGQTQLKKAVPDAVRLLWETVLNEEVAIQHRIRAAELLVKTSGASLQAMPDSVVNVNVGPDATQIIAERLDRLRAVETITIPGELVAEPPPAP